MIAASVGPIREYFAAQGLGASVVFGRRAHPSRVNQGAGSANRVIIQPGDDGGRLGRIAPTHQPGPRDLGNNDVARSLANWEALYTVFVWAASLSRGEEATFEAAEELFQWVVRAFAAVYPAEHAWGDIGLVVDPAVLVHGTELRVALTVRFPLYDVPLKRVFPSGQVNKGTPPGA